MSAVRVWRAEDGDAGEVARLLVAFRDWHGGTSPSAASFLASVTALLGDASTEFLLASASAADTTDRANGASAEAVCQLRFRHSVWTGVEDCWLEDLYVDGTARRQGLGRALVLASLDRARARGAARIELDTSEHNDAAIALYTSLGFSPSSKSGGSQPSGRDLFFGRRLS
jgi:ribosomal protein S18 acetylase RimI-like enzyme